MKSKLIILILFFLSSCSSAWHLKRAIKKNPSIIQNKVDTVREIIPGTTLTIFGKDSIIINEPKVYIKAKSFGDSMSLFYEFLPDTIIKIETKTVFNVPKTRYQTKIEYRTIKEFEKTKRNKNEFDFKTEKVKQKKSNFSPFFIGFLTALLFVSMFFIYKRKKI